MKIKPTGKRVLVRLYEDTDKTKSGLYIPERAKTALSKCCLGEVKEVSDDPEVKLTPNSVVMLARLAGVAMPWDDYLRIVYVDDILGICTLDPEEKPDEVIAQ